MKGNKWFLVPEAGKHGVWGFDTQTKEERYVSVSDYAGFSGSSGTSEPPEAPEVDDPQKTPEPQAENKLTIVSGRPTGAQASTCLLGARFGEYVIPGTGWLINKRYVMTAGHMLYRADYGYADHIAVYVSPSGGQTTCKQVRMGYQYHVADEYKQGALNVDYTDPGNYQNFGRFDDWGVIRLAEDLTVDVTILGRYAVPNAVAMKGTYFTQGYPREYGLNAQREWHDVYMYSESGVIEHDVTMSQRALGLVFTSMEVYAGQSGSPIYNYKSGWGNAIQGTIIGSGEITGQGYVILYNSWLDAWVNLNCKI